MDGRRTIHILTAFIFTMVGGTCGYYFIEDWSLIDSFFMTVITITTVGYREIGGELSNAGKIFTIILILSGLGVATLWLSHASSLIIKGELNRALGRRRMQQEIKALKNHFIIAGYGRTGRVIAERLKHKKTPYIIIENHPDKIKKLEEEGLLHLRGEASEEEVLIQAGVAKAKGFIAVVSTDAENAFAIMTAKQLNPKLLIIARALDSTSVRNLKNAGANKVIAPYVLGGMRIAHAVTHPHAADFIDVLENVQAQHIEMTDLEIYPGSKLEGIKLSDGLIRDKGVIVVGIRRQNGEFVFQPGSTTVINTNDHLILMGQSENLKKLYDLT